MDGNADSKAALTASDLGAGPAVTPIPSLHYPMRSFFFLGSLALNAGLAMMTVSGSLTKEPSSTLPQESSTAPNNPASKKQSLSSLASAGPSLDAAKLSAILREDDVLSLTAFIRSLELSREEQNQIIDGFLRLRLDRELAALQHKKQEFWKSSGYNGCCGPSRSDPAREAIFQAFQEQRNLAGTRDKNSRDYDQLYEYRALPEERIKALKTISEDYDDLLAQVREKAGNFRLPSDEATIKLLNEERQKDLQAALSPEEQKLVALSNSELTRLISRKYGDAIADQENFKRLYALHETLEQRYGESLWYPWQNDKKSAEQLSVEQQAKEALEAQAAALLGSDKMASLARANDQDVHIAQEASKRLGLDPLATERQLLQLRQNAAQNAQLVISNPGLDKTAKENSLKAIAHGTRLQLESVLGKEGTETYTQRSQWLRLLNNGAAFKTNALGETQGLPVNNPPEFD